jgi:hypothetical protein
MDRAGKKQEKLPGMVKRRSRADGCRQGKFPANKDCRPRRGVQFPESGAIIQADGLKKVDFRKALSATNFPAKRSCGAH